MGTETSTVSSPSLIHPYEDGLYAPFGDPRMDIDRADSNVPSNSLYVHDKKPSLLNTPFAGIWSIKYPNSIAPIPRMGQFHYYDEENNRFYIGYGIDENNQLMSDFWVLNTKEEQWNQIKLTGDLISGRVGARCALVDDKLYIFGGFADNQYFSDLHSIDINTGIVNYIQTTGELPQSRTAPLVSHYNGNLYVWGGFNGEWPSSLHILNLTSFEWKEIPQDLAGRITSPGVSIGNKYLTFGGSKSGGMVVLNFDENRIYLEQTSGNEPISSVLGSGMVLVNNYLFFFGGKSASNWTLMYACDTDRMWWFIFHVMPDGDTVSIADGSVNELGLFMLPRMHSFAVCYVKEKREIVACLGHPMKDPPPLFCVNIAGALSVLHLREDMLQMFP